MMTRKDYQKIASIISSHECPSLATWDRLATWNECRNELAERMAYWLGKDNPNFDHDKFIKATRNW